MRHNSEFELRHVCFVAHLNKASGWVFMILAIRPSVRPFTPLNDFYQTPGPNFFKLHVAPSVKGGLKICTNGHGPLIKMSAMSIYVETLKIFFSRTASKLNLRIYSIWDSWSTKFVQMMTVPLIFFGKIKISKDLL